jgi:hypothetical protein
MLPTGIRFKVERKAQLNQQVVIRSLLELAFLRNTGWLGVFGTVPDGDIGDDIS